MHLLMRILVIGFHHGVMKKEVPTGRLKTIDRWSRTCKKCGLKEYTTEAEVVEVKKAPSFKK